MPEVELLTAVPLSEDTQRTILEQAGLFAKNPAGYPGLSLKMNPAVGLDPEFRPVAYDTRHTTGKMVHCSICVQRQEHYDGAIVRLLDGHVGLVGNSCGRNHFFGDNGWTAISNRLRQDSEHALFVARFGNAREALAGIDEVLGHWIRELHTINGAQNQFRVQLPKLFTAIAQKGHGGTLYVDEEVQIPFRDRKGGIEMRTELQTVAFCKLDCAWFFNSKDFAGTVEKIRDRLHQAGNYLRADAKPHNINAVKKMMRDCRRDLEEVANHQNGLRFLLSTKTLNLVAQWGNRSVNGNDTYQSQGLLLEVTRRGTSSGSVDLGKLPRKLENFWEEVKALWPTL